MAKKGGLIPALPSDFSKSKYWESFFKKRVNAFEWYGTYYELCGILHRYIKPSDNILMAGCGNSELGENMYDAGLKSIMNIDISQTAIDQMLKRRGDRRTLEYVKMDLTDLKFEDEHFSVIVDKGTLDAIMSDDSSQSNETADKIFSEYFRVLKNGGRYVCVTLAQDYILNKILEYFTKNDWLVRLHKVFMSDENQSNNLPVFAFVMTKFKNLPKKILEVCVDDSFTPTRVAEKENIKEFVKSQQHYAAYKSSLNKEVDPTKDNPPIELFSATDSVNPRFILHIVDKSSSKLHCKFAVFIVPQGRESEWLFASNEGRRSVAEQTPFKRVLFVSLHPEHEYGTREDLQAELNSTVMDFAPPGTQPSDNVPYLSTNNEDMGHRIVRCKGESAINGKYIVEDFAKDGDAWYRHLVLMLRQSIVQTEIRLKKDPSASGRKSSKRNTKTDISTEGLIPDHTYLTSGYDQPAIAGVVLKQSPDSEFNAMAIGVGGGALSTFLHHNFKNCNLTAIELDPAMIEVAREWFGLPKNGERFNAHVADGIKFVEDEAKRIEVAGNEGKYDIIIIDVDGKEYSFGISCPAVSFVKLDYLMKVAKIMKPDGLLMFNLLCWDEKMRAKVIYNLCRVFKVVARSRCEAFHNELVYCFKDKPNFEPTASTKSAKKRNKRKKGGKKAFSPKNLDQNENLDKVVKETENSLNDLSLSPSSGQETMEVEGCNHSDTISNPNNCHSKDNPTSKSNNYQHLDNLSFTSPDFIPPKSKKPLHLENYQPNLFNYWRERTKTWGKEREMCASTIELTPMIENIMVEQEVEYYIGSE
ncbi:eEF1A lysine and N-terminal methyltransferase-like [Styela clava]